MIFDISGKAIADDNAVIELAENLAKDLRSARGLQREERERAGHKGPQPIQLFVVRVTGFSHRRFDKKRALAPAV